MKLLLDEMYDATLVEALRDASIDAVTVAELGLAGRSDPEIFTPAVAADHILLTEDVADFARIAADHLTTGQHHLRGPAADAAQARQTVDGGSIGELVQGLQVDLAGDDRAGGLDDRPCLAQAEAVAPELLGRHAGEPIGIGKRAWTGGIAGYRSPVSGGEPVEQVDPHVQRQLLAGDAVDERLEHRRKARWPKAAQPQGERPEQRIALRHRCERRQVDAQPQEPVERAPRTLLRLLVDRSAHEQHAQPRTAQRIMLGDGDSGRTTVVDRHDPPIRGPVEAVNRVA